jgi:hypothetical protein
MPSAWLTAVLDESDVGDGKADEEKTRSVIDACNMFVLISVSRLSLLSA